MGKSFKDDAFISVGALQLDPPYQPVETPDVLRAFPAQVGHLMPNPHEIPDGYWLSHLGTPEEKQWVAIADKWFMYGLSDGVEVHMKEGFDGETCWWHLSTIMRSFQPKHEHKIASIAFLMSVWMVAIVDDDRVYGSPSTTTP